MKFLNLLLISVLLFLGTSCVKDNLKTRYLLTDEMKDQNPYQTGDIVMFINANSDTLMFCLKEKYHI